MAAKTEGEEAASQHSGAGRASVTEPREEDAKIHNIELQSIPARADEDPTATDSEADTGGLAGVKRIEATAQVWTKSWLIAAYIL